MSSSAAELFNSDDVYLGVWTNWSHGRIRGATLTMSRRNGGLLTAFLALFVGAAGTSFWKIGCFLIHRYLSSKHAADALYHQRQAILRNASNSQSGLVTLFHTCWAWRRNGLAPFWRLLPSILFAILTFIGFIIAGIFSSAVATSMGQEVLLKSSNCGYWSFDDSDIGQWILWHPYVSKSVASSLAYAQRCYLKDVNPRDCAIFFEPRLQWKTDYNATCPFPSKKDICLSDSGNLRLDSGYINSDHHLGINSSPETRFLIRTVVECAPLRTRGYTRNTTTVPTNQRSGATNTDDWKLSTSNNITEYFYGKTNYSVWNSTYQYSAKISGVNSYDGTAETANYDYALSAWAAFADVDGTVMKEPGNFTPIPALWANATDVMLFFLSANDVKFFKACDDPWFAATAIAHEFDPTGASGNTTVTYYVRDEPARVLGCASRYQFCNSDSKSGKSCTPLAGYYCAIAAADALWRTDGHGDLFNTSIFNILPSVADLRGVVSVAGIASLKARDTLQDGLQGPLPNNQWQLEVENWYGATLADLQRMTVEYATGPTEPALLQVLERPQTEGERRLCHSVKIRSDAVTSYSILGLGILLGLCGLLIIVSVTIEPLTEWVGKKFGRGNYQQIEWVSNNTLQLQRLAHEELGCGTWAGGNFPITTASETLAVLDISEPGHPKLVNPALAHASVATVNASSPLMDASPSLADTSSPSADASSSMVDASPPLIESSSSASLKDISSQESSNAATDT